MSGKNKVDFLLEIVKGSTTTKQEQAESEPQLDGVCGGHCDAEAMTEDEAEVRDQPPTSPPLTESSPSKPTSVPEGAWVVRDFDFYGNPISERVQPGRINTGAVHHLTTVSPANSTNRQLTTRREFTTAFPDGSTAPSCLVNFSMCLMNSLICSAGPCMLQDSNADDTASKSRPLCGLSQEAAAIAEVEAELQMELEKIRKQKIEMEQWYQREIARHDVDRTQLQIQMEQKIVSMMEARLHLESEYRKEMDKEVSEVRTLVNTQLDLGSRSDVSDVADVTDAAVTVTDEVNNTILSPTAETSIPLELRKPVVQAPRVEPCETKTDATKSTIVLTCTDEDSAIEAETTFTSYPVIASE